MPLERPRASQPHYGEHLGDPDYWGPYVAEVLARHRLPVAVPEPPFVGSFPTFLVGDVVVKLFGDLFEGVRSSSVELAMHELLAGHPEIAAPGLVASGRLFESEDETWPYLVTERVGGVAVRDAVLDDDTLKGVAGELGRQVAHLHRLPAPDVVAARDLLPELRAAATARLERFGLPRHLLDQVPEYMADASRERVLVHADITADHVFVDRDGLVGVIDWGDALVADPWYELVAVRFDGLRGDADLFSMFLDAGGWTRGPDFARHLLQGVLEFQFNAVSAVAELVDLYDVGSLEQLAAALA